VVLVRENCKMIRASVADFEKGKTRTRKKDGEKEGGEWGPEIRRGKMEN